MSKAFTIYAIIVTGLYATSAWQGWELFAARRGVIPTEVRQSAGGYRSFTYWRGGK